MKIGKYGVELIKSFESCRLESYQDGAGVWTIGYGHTGTAKQGQKISQDTANELFLKDLVRFERAVNEHVHVPLTQSMYDALVSFSFNLGTGALISSTLLKKLNSGDYVGAADEFPKWRNVAGNVSRGIVRRRYAEAGMFLADGFPQ